MTRLIVLIAIFLQCCNAQLVGPTVTPTDEANNELGSAATATPDLTGNGLSGLVATTPTLSTQPTIIIVSGCGTLCSRTSAGSQTPTASGSAKVNDTDLTADNHKKNVIIIACSVVAGVLLILASFLICFCYRRKRQREGSFDYNKKQPAIAGSSNETKEDDNIKTYNITAQEMYSTNNGNHEQNEEKITPPVVLYTDVIKQSQQHNGKPSARLSKYNFLAQMFTQMKESYSLGAMVLAQDSVNDRTQQNSLSEKSNDPIYQAQNLEKNSVRDQSSQLNPYQMNHFNPINQDRSTASTPLPESGRESTTTVGTLHAPLLKNNGLFPPRAHTKPKTRSPTQNKRSDDSSEIASSDKSTNAKTVEKTGSSRPYNFI